MTRGKSETGGSALAYSMFLKCQPEADIFFARPYFFSIFSSCGYLIPNFCTSSCPWTSRCLQISVAQNPDLGNSFFGMFSSWSSRFATAWKKIHVPGKGAVSVARSLRGLRRHRHPIWRTSIGLGKLQRPHCNLTGIMISKEHHPQMTFIQVSEIL